MPSFLHDLRRLSKSSFKTERSSNSNSSSDSANGVETSNKSTSTLNTANGSSTPPSTLPSQKSATNLQSFGAELRRPSPSIYPSGSGSSRYSIAGGSMLTLNSNPTSPRPQTSAATSPYAPCVLSVSDNSWVHQKVLLIFGQVADPAQQSFDGALYVCHHQDSFPATQWPVCDSHFKALVHLQPGPNRIRLDFVSPKVPAFNGAAAHSSWICINYLPLVSMPPLDLVILLGKDSDGTYDAVPERKQREGNGLETAIRKFKMAAYLWQAFTGEQMNRNSFGRRVFRFEEEYQAGTLSQRDAEVPTMRNEARIHVIRSKKTVAELRDLDIAQQYGPAKNKGDLFSIAMEDVQEYFNPAPGQKRYVSVLMLDAHWDNQAGVIRGHAALGGGAGDIQLAICGSQALQSYPSNFEEVVTAFTDCTRTDTRFVANDCNESGSNWEAANIGIGAHMHETGHLFGCPHQESGVMLRDYVRLNRTFVSREPYSTRTKEPGQRLCLPADECAWHRLDCLRFRYHPCFRLPSDPPMPADDSVQVWAVDNGNVLVTAASGVAWIELFAEGDDVCKSSIEYLDVKSGPLAPLPKQVLLTESDLRSRLPADKRKRKLKLEIFSGGSAKHVVENFNDLVSKTSRIKIASSQFGFRGGKLGFSQQEGSRPEELILSNAIDQKKLLLAVKVYAGFAMDGIEFFFDDMTSQLFGKRGGTGSDFPLDTRRGELILGFYLRAGLWIDGLQIITNLGRRSEIYGNPTGGSGHTLIPPRGYTFAGIFGSSGQWMDGFGLIITR